MGIGAVLFKRRLIISGTFAVFLLALFLPYPAHAVIMAVEYQTKSLSLNERMDILRDPSGKLTIEDMTRPEVAGSFRPVSKRFSAGYTKDVVWARFTLQKKDVKVDDEWWLEIYPTFLDYVTLYEPDGPDIYGEKRSFREKSAGRLLPVSAREMAERNYMFIIRLADTGPHTYYMRVRTTGTMFIDAGLWDPHSFTKASGTISVLLGGFYGILGLIMILNLLFWFVLKDRLFIIYALFLVASAGAIAPGNGYTALYLFPESPKMVYLMTGIFIPLLHIAGILLLEELFCIDKRSFWGRSLFAARAFAVFSLIMILSGQFRLVAAPLQFMGLYLCVISVIVAGMGIYRRIPLAKLYAVTFIMYYMGGIMVTVRNTNFLGLAHPFMDNAFQIGTLFHMVLIQIAIAFRFNRMEQERKETREKMATEMIRSQKLESMAVLGGGIAHDFNNMLTVIMSTVTLAKMYARENSNVIGKLEEAEHEIMHARELTNQLLTFAKGGAPVKSLSSLSDLLRDTVEFSMKGSTAKCEFSIADDLWSAEIDRTQISQVISNLVINAIQAMPERGRIKVTARNEVITVADSALLDGRYVIISIEDNGPGIPSENMGKIFDPFFTTKPKGSGLGLATCYSIINRHSGFIDVQSKVGKGAVFSIYLPALLKPYKAEVPPAGAELKGAGSVLLMDDDEGLLKNVGELLEGIGYEVETARNGEEAVILYKRARALSRPFDAVVLDLTVKDGMGGRACLQEILAIDLFVKALVMSGYSEDAVLSEFKQHGFSAVVTKPFTVEELHHSIQKLMAEKGDSSA